MPYPAEFCCELGIAMLTPKRLLLVATMYIQVSFQRRLCCKQFIAYLALMFFLVNSFRMPF